MLPSALRHLKPCGSRATTPLLGSAFSVAKKRTTRLAHTHSSAPLSWEARGVSELVKALNKEIRSCKTLEGLGDHFNANMSNYNGASVGAVWVTLANLPGDKEMRRAFARKPLLGKTLATVHVMESRTLANVLWAMGKLQLDLTKESNGPYLAQMIEDRVVEFLSRGEFDEGRHAEQLWYGLAFSGYPWSQEVLQLMVARTLPELTTWDTKSRCQVLLHISILCGTLVSDEQRRHLAAAVEGSVASWSMDEQETYRSAPSVIKSVQRLGLPVSPACVKKLNSIAISTPLVIQQEFRFKSVAHTLLNLLQLGCPISQGEASRWEDVLLTAWRAEQKRPEEKLEGFSLLLNSLLAVPSFVPSEELQSQLVEVAASHAGTCYTGAARQMLKAAEAWAVVLPPDLVQRLNERAAGRKPAASGARRGGGSGRPGGTAGGRSVRDTSGTGQGTGTGGARPTPHDPRGTRHAA